MYYTHSDAYTIYSQCCLMLDMDVCELTPCREYERNKENRHMGHLTIIVYAMGKKGLEQWCSRIKYIK